MLLVLEELLRPCQPRCVLLEFLQGPIELVGPGERDSLLLLDELLQRPEQ